MFVYDDIQPHLVFLIMLLILIWTFGTWLTWQNRKMYSDIIPQYDWVSRIGLIAGTSVMLFDLWFLSLFYSELRLGMSILFAFITVSVGGYLARYFEWLVFSLEKQEGYWEHLIIEYYKEEYKDGLGPRGVQKMVTSMVPDWWIELLPTNTRGEIRSALKKINSGTEDLAQRRQARFS